MIKNIYIFGSSGFIGNEISEYFKTKKNSFKIINIDKKNYDLLKISSIKKLEKKIKNNSIILFCSGIKKQLGDNLEVYNKNMSIINNFILSIKKRKKLSIIYFSSAAVYGEDFNHKSKIKELTNTNIKTFYGCAKINSEIILKKFCEEKFFRLSVIRFPLIYGYNDASKGYGPTKFFFNFINKEKIVLWGDGTELREFIYIKDIPKFVYLVIKNNFEGTINFASGKSYSYIETIKILEKLNGANCEVIGKKRSKSKVNHYFNNKKLKKIFPKFRFTKLDLALKDMIKIHKRKKNRNE